MRSKKIVYTLSAAAAALLLSSCNTAPPSAPANPNAGTAAPPQTVQTADNELFIYTVWPAFFVDQDIFNRQVTQYVEQKFPGVKIKHVAWDDGRRYEDLVAAGTIPDIIMDNARMNLQRYIFKNELEFDIRDLMKKYNFDTGRLDPNIFAQMQNVKQTGEIYGLPFHVSDFILFYNIDIFDKFGVEYPKAGMTYDEAYELAKKLTRVEGDITYKGYSQNPGHYMNYNQLSLSPLHPTEDRGNMNTDGWAKLVNNLRRFYEIPANNFDTVENFARKGNLAMAVATVDKIVAWHEQNPTINFNIAPIPSFADVPNTKSQPNLYSMYITKQSTKKDLAFQVMDYLLSEEYWMEVSKEGVIGPLESKAVQEVFGQNLPQLQGKDTQAIFQSRNAMPPAARAEGLTYVDVIMQYPFQPLIFNESKDTVTALRMTDEQTNKAIETKKAAESE